MRDRTTKPLLSALCADPLWTAQSSSWRHRMCQRAGGRFISEVRDLELTDGECTCPCHKNNAPAVTNILDNEIAREVYTLT